MNMQIVNIINNNTKFRMDKFDRFKSNFYNSLKK